MTFANARSSYRKAETIKPVEPTDPHEIIGVTLRELEKSLRVMAAAKANGGAYPSQHVNRAFTAIYILQSSLDFDKGGEIATNLFRVYEFCRLQVAEAFAKNPDAQLEQGAEHIAGILSAWDEIGGQAKAPE
ncbi:flagellar biosynthesis protein FliS [Marivivens niveibacter]|uniref:Flagellar biosynthesis protein FliS n=1 Tax=Marivivens niveibacter TaxID=1930667 RepID=A0A251X0W6_9RHOB|nr:flagellar protein FliS [Marivivens niveibacter]OUD10201.1 flagellar biosynthesis protein FliS [Marivivens niveibacter]